MGRGRKSFSSSITNNWEKAFYKSIGFYITSINIGLSRTFKNEPLKKHIKIIGGFAFKNAEYKKSGVPIIRISDFNNERIILDNVVYYDELKELEKYVLNESDIIIALTGGTIGKLGIVQAGLGKLYLNQRVGKFEVLHPAEFEKEYIYWIARGVEGIVKNLAWGAAIPNVSPKQIEELLFPIPTKEIQNKIISFLNDLRDNTLIEDKVYFDFEVEREIKLVQNKLVKVFEINNELSSQLTQIENLNQVILQEAVQGKLVNQDPNNEPAIEFLKQIDLERETKVKSKKLQNKYYTNKFEELITRHELPKTWNWQTIGSIADLKTGATPSTANPDFYGGNIKWLVSGDIHKNEIFDCDKRITIDGMKHSNCSILPINSVLIALNGQGKTRATVALLKCEATCNQSLVAIIPYYDDVYHSKFIFYFLKFIYFQIREITGQTKRRGLNMKLISQLPIPLPPIDEQKRIVIEIEKQLAKTKLLKEHIISNQQATEQLLKALLHQAFK